ncbi:hypothetical protein BJY00DRAFT_285838 [Aspergillus carlsbadensis]|nr:hypothetical protein BJY00DRAFT_285838 [Aspergillus carlsbadensis]
MRCKPLCFLTVGSRAVNATWVGVGLQSCRPWPGGAACPLPCYYIWSIIPQLLSRGDFVPKDPNVPKCKRLPRPRLGIPGRSAIENLRPIARSNYLPYCIAADLFIVYEGECGVLSAGYLTPPLSPFVPSGG